MKPIVKAMSYNRCVERINQMSVAADQARTRPRFDPTGIRCDRGKLIDISATGLAVRGSKWGKIGKTYHVELCSSTARLVAEVEVVRIKSTGLLKCETGCRFVSPDQVGPQLLDLVRERVGSAGGEFMTRSKSPEPQQPRQPTQTRVPQQATRSRTDQDGRRSGVPVDPYNRPANVMIPMIPADALKRKKPTSGPQPAPMQRSAPDAPGQQQPPATAPAQDAETQRQTPQSQHAPEPARYAPIHRPAPGQQEPGPARAPDQARPAQPQPPQSDKSEQDGLSREDANFWTRATRGQIKDPPAA